MIKIGRYWINPDFIAVVDFGSEGKADKAIMGLSILSGEGLYTLEFEGEDRDALFDWLCLVEDDRPGDETGGRAAVQGEGEPY